MTPAKFKQVANAQIKMCKEVLEAREQRYADDDDRLYNFKQAAYLNVALPEDSLWGMVSKQIVALSTEIRRADYREAISVEDATEYITDIINYMLLLRGLIVEANE